MLDVGLGADTGAEDTVVAAPPHDELEAPPHDELEPQPIPPQSL